MALWPALVILAILIEYISCGYSSLLSEDYPLIKSLGVAFKNRGDDLDVSIKEKLKAQYEQIRKASQESFENFEKSMNERRTHSTLATDEELMSRELKTYTDITAIPPEKRDTWNIQSRRTRANKLLNTALRRREHSQALRLEKLNHQGLNSHVHHSKTEYSDS